jgi:hypothetical protein
VHAAAPRQQQNQHGSSSSSSSKEEAPADATASTAGPQQQQQQQWQLDSQAAGSSRSSSQTLQNRQQQQQAWHALFGSCAWKEACSLIDAATLLRWADGDVVGRVLTQMLQGPLMIHDARDDLAKIVREQVQQDLALDLPVRVALAFVNAAHSARIGLIEQRSNTFAQFYGFDAGRWLEEERRKRRHNHRMAQMFREQTEDTKLSSAAVRKLQQEWRDLESDDEDESWDYTGAAAAVAGETAADDVSDLSLWRSSLAAVGSSGASSLAAAGHGSSSSRRKEAQELIKSAVEQGHAAVRCVCCSQLYALVERLCSVLILQAVEYAASNVRLQQNSVLSTRCYICCRQLQSVQLAVCCLAGN